MAYVLGGGNQEALGFTTAIANFALEAMHESQGLVDYTRVVAPNQGDTYLVPNFGAITYQDYDPAAAPGTGFGVGGAVEQNPDLAQGSIQATPTVAATAFDVFYSWTTSFELAATIGEELGGSYGEKVDQRVCKAFQSFKATTQNTVVVGSDGFNQMVSLSAMELAEADVAGAVAADSEFYANTVLGLVQNVKQNYVVAKLPGTPIIVLDSNGSTTAAGTGKSGSSMIRALSELSGGAIQTAPGQGGSAISSLGEELLATGTLTNLYGCRVIFSNFLTTILAADPAPRTINGVAQDCLIGAYFHETAIFTVLKEGLQVKMGEKPGGLQMWLTGLAYMGAGVADVRRGGAINIAQS